MHFDPCRSDTLKGLLTEKSSVQINEVTNVWICRSVQPFLWHNFMLAMVFVLLKLLKLHVLVNSRHHGSPIHVMIVFTKGTHCYLQGDSAVLRRLQLASLVYNSWTGRGTDPASMAARLLDGSVDALEAFVCAANASPYDEVEQRAAQKELQSPAASAPCGNEEAASSQSSAERNCQSGIPRRHMDNLTYDAFVLEFMAPNLPVMIEVWCVC